MTTTVTNDRTAPIKKLLIANRRELGGYALLDLRLTIALAPGWRLQARAENVFDKDYETAAFFNPPGRSLALTLRYQPS